ncbi:MAG TPA: hypothetical protein ENL35_11675, partial [Chloroflexi bacterium]|nr:hypothetical protein [Chloroflexota bacterium]
MATETHEHIPQQRLQLAYALIALALLAFLARLVQLQFLEYRTYLADADENRFVEVSIPAPRGVIYDRNGFQLVRNIPSFRVTITPALLPDSQAEIDAIYGRISELTGIPIDKEGPPAAPCVPGRGIRQLVEEGLTIRPFDPWPVACDVDEEVARILREEQADMPGVEVIAVPVRDYATGALTSAVIGYLGPIPAALKDFYEEQGFRADRDKIGYAGVEVGYNGMYQEILAGRNGLKRVERDVAGQVIREVGTFQ